MGTTGPASYHQPTATNGGESVPEHTVSERPGEVDPVVVSLLRNRIRFAPAVVAQAVIELEYAGLLRVEPERGGGVSALLTGSAVDGADDVDGVDGAGIADVAESAAATNGTVSMASAGPGAGTGAGGAPPWERLVLQRLRARALPGVPTPLSVLTTVDGGGFWDWRLEFEQGLLAAAERAGLIERRLAPRQTIGLVCALTAVIAGAVGWVVAVLLRPSPGFGAALATALFGFILFSTTIGRLAQHRLSEAGRRTVQQAEASLAQADPAAQAREQVIRDGLIPLPKDHVWSSHGGSWRVVGLGSRFGDAKRLPRQVREALPDRRVLACQVVKRWYVPGGRERDPAYCAAFDDGASSFTWSFTLPERTWEGLAVGEVVLVDFSPRRHKLYEVRRLDGPEL
jgi:hypothetical protein